MFKAGIYIRNKHGLKGFYKGYMPGLILYSAMFFEDLVEIIIQ